MTPEFPMKIRSLLAATATCAFACSAFAADAPDKAKAAPPAHPNGPDAAAADVAKMTVPAGLQSTLFASEPMVVNPADMDVDERESHPSHVAPARCPLHPPTRRCSIVPSPSTGDPHHGHSPSCIASSFITWM